jgi:nicotinic acid mononucleotide adenylyltransferase
LRKLFLDDDMVFLFGSDVVEGLASWPHSKELLESSEVVIGLRLNAERSSVHAIVESWKSQPKTVTIFDSFAPEVSSGKIREALRHRQPIKGLLKSVEQYNNRNWLYVSFD